MDIEALVESIETLDVTVDGREALSSVQAGITAS